MVVEGRIRGCTRHLPVAAMISGVREIVSSVTICSSSIVRRKGGRGGDFCPALRMNPRIVFVGLLGS